MTSFAEATFLLCAIATFIVLLVVVAIKDDDFHQTCRKQGGTAEPFNCRPIPICSAPDQFPCPTIESCNWRCINLPAEAP